MAMIELDLFGELAPATTHGSILAESWDYPPFSVLSTRDGWWQERKRKWVAMGIKSEIGRDADSYSCNGDAIKKYDYLPDIATGTSIFDPVICELACKWFCPEGGTIIDPFAGGSVRGVVASVLGRHYHGVELRAEQVEANRLQGADLCPAPAPVWHQGDSRNIGAICAGVAADFVFSCPPYADLEVYSDDPQDLSTLAYTDFKAAYFEIIAKTCALLRPDSFACFVVGDVRDKKGNYYNFVGDTVEAFKAAGLHYYNEAILVTAVGSLPIRAGKQFKSGRKLGKTHQNILVFVKGDGKRAAARCNGND
jgi:DNA modification methylase